MCNNFNPPPIPIFCNMLLLKIAYCGHGYIKRKSHFNILKLLDMQYILSMHIYETNSKRDFQESKEKEDDKICVFIHAKQS